MLGSPYNWKIIGVPPVFVFKQLKKVKSIILKYSESTFKCIWKLNFKFGTGDKFILYMKQHSIYILTGLILVETNF